MDHINDFLSRPGTRLTVFLPDLRNKVLIKAIQAHFEDGPAIPGLIQDAFYYFEILQKRFPGKLVVKRFQTYPTYSFYKFDDQLVVAAYPTTPRKKDVPAFQLKAGHPFGKFVMEDLEFLLNS